MPSDLPPNLAGTPPYSDMKYAQEQEKQRRRREEERQKAIDADLRLKAEQTQQTK